MAINKKIINSFYLQDELNPDVWYLPNEKFMGDPDAQNYKLKPEIKERLLKVGQLFIDYLDTDLFVHDIIFVGSLVGYNWSEFSDFDIHILIDLNDAGKEKELYEELFRLKKSIFNAAHDIFIKGYETELYVQDLNEKNESQGVYSIMNDKWLKIPKKEEFELDEKKLKQKIQQWIDIIDGVLENAQDEDIEGATKLIKKYREKLRKYRTCGLKKEGEYSYENLVFKYLRRNGYIGKLEDFKNKFVDKKLSLEQENIE
jgi:hypothetical protein